MQALAKPCLIPAMAVSSASRNRHSRGVAAVPVDVLHLWLVSSGRARAVATYGAGPGGVVGIANAFIVMEYE